MCGVLGILKRLYYIFITGHRHLQHEFGMMAKREKLLAIYDAITPRVWVEMALQILYEPTKFYNRVWGL